MSDGNVNLCENIEDILEINDTSHESMEDTNGNDGSFFEPKVQNVVTQGFTSGKKRYLRRVRAIRLNQNLAYFARCTISDVQKVSMIDCCTRKCCQLAN